MQILIKKGAKGEKVESLQIRLDFLLFHYKLGNRINYFDGVFGNGTFRAVVAVQKALKLRQDGIVGRRTLEAMKKAIAGIGNKIVVLDAGHGGIHPYSGQYTTRIWGGGKYYEHRGLILHKQGFFFEGEENRIIVARIKKKLEADGIYVFLLHHKYKDSKYELRRRAAWLRKLKRAGFTGVMESIHSNAVSSSYSQKQKDKINGYHVFTTRDGYTKLSEQSDKASVIVQLEYDKHEHFAGWMRDKDSDGWDIHDHREANFYILRHAELNGFIAYLEEAGFFTSAIDAQFLVQEITRELRALCNAQAAKKILKVLVK